MMRKIYSLIGTLILLLGLSHLAFSQCNNSSSYGSVSAPTTPAPVTITTCAFGGEYSTVTGALSGSTYLFNATGGTGNYITIRQGTPGGTVLGYGFAPLSVVCTASGPLYMHLNTDAACGGSDGSCHTETVACSSCSGGGPIVNDDCSGAIALTCGVTVTGTTAGATSDAVANCITVLNTAPGVWYKLSNASGAVTLSLCGSSYDTKIGVFSGTCAALTCVTGNDDFCGIQSQVSFTAVAGTTYYVLVTGFSTNSGAFTLVPTCTQTYDPCSAITTTSCGTSNTATMTGAGVWSPGNCGYTTPGQEKIYSFTPSSTGTYTLNVTSTSGTGYVDYMYKAASGGCNATGWTCIQDIFSPTTVTFGPLTAGVQYYILLDPETTSSVSETFQINCLCSTSITITESSGVPNNGVICAGASATLTATGGGTYLWSTGATTSSIVVSPASTQTYGVTVTDVNSCVATATATVTVSPLPVATAAASPNPICVGKTLSLTSSGGSTYSWSGPAGYSSSLQNPTIANIQPNQGGVYTVTVTNASGCSNTASVSVSVNTAPTASASVTPNPVCAGELATFTASGGTGYKWSGPNGFNSDNRQFGLHMNPNMAGTYYVTVTNSGGCSSTASVSITVTSAPNATISVSPNPACSGQTVQFSASGGTTYSWTGPAGFSSNLQNPVINNAQYYHSGAYTVVVSNAAGCTKTLTIALKVQQTPAGTISYDDKSTCTGSTLLLYASGGNSYQWSGPAGFSSTLQNPTRPNANSSFSGTYTVVITNTYGCSVTLSVNVTIRPLPSIIAMTTTPEVCEGGTAYLFSSGGVSYNWSGPYGYGSNFQNPIINSIPMYMSGKYTVTGSNEYGCTSTASVTITVQTVNAVANATPNPVPSGGTLYLTASGGTNYQWTGPDGFHSTQQNPIITNFQKAKSGLYSVIVGTSAGCQDTKIILVNIQGGGFGANADYKMEGIYRQVYPNPSSSVIKIDDDFKGVFEYKIISSNGTIPMHGKATVGDNISIQNLPAGTYYIQWNYTANDKPLSFISQFVKTN